MMFDNPFGLVLVSLIIVVALVVSTIFASILFRRVVSTNMVHIVQSRRKTTPYGTMQNTGNVYYQWPSWIPFFGVTVIKLPVSNFDIALNAYEAYDNDRVPFVVDVVAFFRIEDTARAAQRVESMRELMDQLTQIVQGAVRKVLAGNKIDDIMIKRAEFGEAFTLEVKDQLSEWGVEPVKSMELMDIRDTRDSSAVHDIMAKKTSHIEMESRTEVARNRRAAEIAEIDAQRDIDLQKQDAEKSVGERTAQKTQAVGIADEQARQEILSQEKVTRERFMEVERVNQVKKAEITRDEEVVKADQDKQTTVIVAQGHLDAKKLEAQGIQAIGAAEAEAEKLMQLAPVEAQITLAKEIGENVGYQNYLATIASVEAYIKVGAEQAKALQHADVKVISNAGNPTSGMTGVMDLFTAKGGTNIAAGIEAFAQSPLGESFLKQFGFTRDTTSAQTSFNTKPGEENPTA